MAGLGLVVIGCWLLAAGTAVNFLGIASDSGTLHGVKDAAIVGIVTGVLSVVTALAGCWGAYAHKKSCLNTVSLSISVFFCL